MHNHPSGDPSPSQADIQMTKAIIEIAKPLGIAVHDQERAREPEGTAADLGGSCPVESPSPLGNGYLRGQKRDDDSTQSHRALGNSHDFA
jgi:hypothetical protein